MRYPSISQCIIKVCWRGIGMVLERNGFDPKQPYLSRRNTSKWPVHSAGNACRDPTRPRVKDTINGMQKHFGC